MKLRDKGFGQTNRDVGVFTQPFKIKKKPVFRLVV